MKDGITIIGDNVAINGNIFGNGTIDCSGKVDGDIISNTLIVKQNGLINGNIFVDSIIISGSGRIVGNIFANSVKVLRNAEVAGNIKYNKLSTEDGSILNIKCEFIENYDINDIIDKHYGNKNNINTDGNNNAKSKKNTDKLEK